MPLTSRHPEAAGARYLVMEYLEGETLAKRKTLLPALLCILATACGMSVDPSLPVYTTEQTDSAHPGYRRTIVSTAGAEYVNDFEEQSLQIINTDPKQVVGRSRFGNGKICAIDGQDPSVYLAVDVGSEMPAYEVYRNTGHPPFDWRRAAFQKLRLAVPEGPAANKETTDAALIDDVLRTLRTGMPVSPALPPQPLITAGAAGVRAVLLFSDQLPGMAFRPSVFLAPSGEVYMTDSVAVTYAKTGPLVQAAWIAASPQFARWVRTQD
jgi:hypothetical protein